MNFDKIYNGILENYDVNETFLDDILTTLEFRLKKNHYSYKNILKYIREDNLEDQDFIYFESENLIINIRSTLDNLIQLINSAYSFGFQGMEMNIGNVVRHKNCSNALKDVFMVHTHPKNQFWKFISTTRNEIVHEVCIKTKLPMIFDEEYKDGRVSNKVTFINRAGDKEDLIFFYKQCIKLMDELCDNTLHILSHGLN